MSETDRAAIIDTALALADELAASISARDGGRVAALFSGGEFPKYVSNGAVIRDEDLESTTNQYYESLAAIEFRWDRQEVHVLGPEAAVLTSWATYTERKLDGAVTTERAIYTSVLGLGEGGWRFVTSHKSFIR